MRHCEQRLPRRSSSSIPTANAEDGNPHPGFTGEETDSEGPSHLPKVTQLVSSRVRIRSLPSL